MPVSGDPSFAVRRDTVPNEWNNDAYSEVPGSVVDDASAGAVELTARVVGCVARSLLALLQPASRATAPISAADARRDVVRMPAV